MIIEIIVGCDGVELIYASHDSYFYTKLSKLIYIMIATMGNQ